MKALFISAMAAVGAALAAIGTTGCLVFVIDEPTMPKCLIEK